MNTKNTNMELDEQIGVIAQAINKANLKGVFSLDESFVLGQVLGELIKLPKEIEVLKDLARPGLNGEQKTNKNVKATKN